MRAAVYLRMSKSEQEDSPERQLSQIKPYCDRKGYRVVGEYTDLAERGWDDSRPSFQKLLRDAEAGLFDVIVVDEMSRLSRVKHVDYFRFVVGPLADAGVAVDSVAEGWQDPDDLAGGLLTVVQQFKSSGESSTLSRRVQTQFAKMARDGVLYTGKPPFAYRRIRQDGRPKLVPGPASEVETVRFIFSSYSECDLSLADLCRRLEARGILTPTGRSTWEPSTVYRILGDQRYAGYYVFNRQHCGRFNRLTPDGAAPSPNRKNRKGTVRRQVNNPKEAWFVIPDSHEPLVSADTFRRVQERLAANRFRSTPCPGRGDFLLSRLLVCGGCGGWMNAWRKRKRKGLPDAVFYRCSRSQRRGTCMPHIVVEEEVVRGVLGALKTRFLSPEFLARLRAEARRMDEVAAQPGTAQALKEEIDALTKKVERAKKNLSLLDDDLIAAVVADIRAWGSRKAQAEQELAACAAPAFSGKMESLIADLEGRLARMEEADFSGAREELRSCLRESVAWVKVWTQPVPYGKKRRYVLKGGEVVLRPGEPLGCPVVPSGKFNLFTTPAG
jgi:DNA invertase Pin-like site-specific DNA recombinase